MNFDLSGTGLTGKFAKRYHFEDMPDQVGKTAIVTGGSAGIGQSIALAMALAGATVHFTSTTPEHGESTLQAIKEKLAESDRPASKSGKVFYHQLDQGTFSQVVAFAEKMNKELDPEGDDAKGLDYLLCNAGIGVTKLQNTADGLPCHFQINHLSHMLLCHLLTPLLEKTSQLPRNKGKKGAVRIVMQSSQQHKLAPGDIKFESLQEIQADLGGNGNYARSKLMNILFAKEFSARRLIPPPISSNVVILTVHPGAVATTQEHAAQEVYPMLGSILTVASKVLFMAPEQGAESLLWAATSPKVQEEGPEKYQGCYLTQPDDALGWETNQAKDVELAKRLWKISVQVIQDKAGVTIDY